MGNIAQLLKVVSSYQDDTTSENKEKLIRVATDIIDRTGSKDMVNNIIKKVGLKL